jgi:DNA-binding GntR family transcriptional regulator
MAKQSATTRVYESVKRDLLEGVIKPGDRIGDADLRERLRVSRTPVREAMLALEQENLVRIVPRQGYFASEISATDVVDAYQLRFLLEPVITAMAALRIRDDDVDELRELARVSSDGSEPGVAQAIERNKRFHLRVAEIAGNSRMTRVMADVLDALGRLAVIDLRQRRTGESWTSEHLAIVEAIAQHDPVRAAEVVRDTFEPDEGLLLKRTRADLSRVVDEIHGVGRMGVDANLVGRGDPDARS